MRSIHKITLAIAAVLGIQQVYAQSSVTMYGQVDVGVTATTKALGSDGKGRWHAAVDTGAMGTSRWGLKGHEDLGSGMAAIFQLESSIDLDNGSTRTNFQLFDRAAFAGLKTPYGTITFGRDRDFMNEYVSRFTNRGMGLGENYVNYLHRNVAYNWISERHNRSFKYVSPNWNGFEFGIMGSQNPVGGQLDSSDRKKGMMVSLGAKYEEKNRVGLAASYAKGRSDNERVNLPGNRDIFGVSGFYTFSPITLNGGATYTKQKTQFKSYLVDLGARYQINKKTGVHLGGIYAQKKYHNSTKKTKGYEIFMIGDYDFSKRTKAYAGVYYLSAKTSPTNSAGSGVTVTNDGVSGISNRAEVDYDATTQTAKSDQVAFRLGVRHRF